MDTVEMTWLRTFKIWWYWLWRAMLMTFIVALIAGFILGLVLAPFIESPATLKVIGNLIGGAIGVFFGLLVLKSVPEKRFSDFRVILVSNDFDDEVDRGQP